MNRLVSVVFARQHSRRSNPGRATTCLCERQRREAIQLIDYRGTGYHVKKPWPARCFFGMGMNRLVSAVFARQRSRRSNPGRTTTCLCERQRREAIQLIDCRRTGLPRQKTMACPHFLDFLEMASKWFFRSYLIIFSTTCNLS